MLAWRISGLYSSDRKRQSDLIRIDVLQAINILKKWIEKITIVSKASRIDAFK